jgi:hypothetical protein
MKRFWYWLDREHPWDNWVMAFVVFPASIALAIGLGYALSYVLKAI